MSGNPLIRSHNSATKYSQIVNEAHMFETTIKSVNAACNDIIGKMYCLEALFEPYTMDDNFDPLFAFKATLDPDTIHHHQAMW